MRLPQESNLLFGLPIVLDTDSEDIKVGQKARAHRALCPSLPRQHSRRAPTPIASGSFDV